MTTTMTGTIINKARKNNYQRMYMRIRQQNQRGIDKAFQLDNEKKIMNEDLRKITWQQMLYFVSYFYPQEKASFERLRKEHKNYWKIRDIFKRMYLER